MLRTAISSIVVSLLLVTSASPCGFHNYTPQRTLVDKLIDSDEIVLARSAPDNPFRFQAFEALEGDLSNVEIPHLVDSSTRRRLEREPNSAVLFSREEVYGPWKRIALIDSALAPVLATIMERLPAWQDGAYEDRFRFFGSLVGHPDTRVHQMALRELDLADYELLSEMDIEVEPSRLLSSLDDPMEFDLRPIRLLLLGISGEMSQRERFEEGVASHVRSEGDYIGIYATAMIELLGAEAIDELAGRYLTDRSLSLLSRELLLEAISLHAQTAEVELQATISVAIESALWIDPELAGAVARQFGIRSNWSHQALLQAVYDANQIRNTADSQDVLQYLTLAKEADTLH